jgi:hypothetical protein
MTNERMTEVAAILVAELEVFEVAEFAHLLQTAIMASYPEEELKIIADQFEAAGITIADIPCKRHPT